MNDQGDNGAGDLLSATRSPKTLKGIGVRRLNRLPLLIGGVVVLIVTFLIVWTASERGKQNTPKEPDHGGSSQDFAAAVAGDRVGYVSPERSAANSGQAQAVNAAPAPPAATPTPNEEAEARRKAFYEALFAKSDVQDPMVQQMNNIRQQSISAAEAKKAVAADSNNLGGSTPDDIASYERKVAATQKGLGLNGEPVPPPDPNSLSTYDGNGPARDRWKLNTHLEAPTTPYILRTGAVIPGLLLSAMESELPGAITAQVSQDVYDTPTGNFLLIPQGSRLVGAYSNAVQYGQARIFVAWQRIIYPDGSALDIGAMPGADEQGESGFRDQVNNHFVRIFGSALLMSVVTGGITISQPQSTNSNSTHLSTQDALGAALGQQLGQATSDMLEKNLSIAPTLKIRPGYRFNIMVVKDLTLDRPYVVGN
jgi:type IV secretory pathway VirB10-like protein